MTSEVIIAVRGEMPENLIATVKQAKRSTDVCVVIDGEEAGNECPEEVKGMARVLLVEGEPVGCGYARHVGIESSKADVVIIMDGHMKLEKGWHAKIMQHHKNRKNHVACCRCRHLDQDGKPIGDPDESGALIRYKSTEPHGLKYALTAKWNPAKPSKGKIPCILGACYSMRREWYKQIGSPLSILRAWGGDEEVLSLATWIMGGTVYLLPVVAGHIYAAKNKGRIKTADEQDAIWANRYAVVDALPMPEIVRADLRKWLNSSNRMCKTVPRMNEETQALADVLATGPRSWSWLIDNGIIDGYEQPDTSAYNPPEAPKDDTPQVIVRQQEVCERCGALNPFVQITGRRNTAAFGLSYARCKRCGHKGQLRIMR
jgi:glycosyltransferase involved in cell wall biosynthesis/DNA-directed RNA polymerase subunit RPC12/RpoP